MRFYRILIKEAPAGIFPKTPDGSTWSSHPWGGDKADPGAQEIELDIHLMQGHQPDVDNNVIIIKGVAWKQITKAANLINMNCEVYAGMKPGLPLATQQSRHTGLLVSGIIQKCWGNWERNEMSIGITLGAGNDVGGSDSNAPNAPDANTTPSSSPPGGDGGATGGSPMSVPMMNRVGPRSIDHRRFPVGPVGPTINPLMDLGSLGGLMSGSGINIGGLIPGFFGGGVPGLSQPLNLIHNLMPNMSLESAIRETLTRAFPKAKVLIGISPGLKLNYQDAGMYQNMKQWATYIQNLSHSIMGMKNYPGIKTFIHGNTIRVTDFTSPLSGGGDPSSITTGTKEGNISVADILGQPTWVNHQQVHLKVVMRPDLVQGMSVKLPPNILMALTGDTNVLGSGSEQRTNLSFSGSFIIDHVQHVGAFRSPVGDDWVTNYVLTTPDVGGSKGSGGNGGSGGSGSGATPNAAPNAAPTSINPASASPARIASMITKSNYAQNPLSAPTTSYRGFGSVVNRTPRR